MVDIVNRRAEGKVQKPTDSVRLHDMPLDPVDTFSRAGIELRHADFQSVDAL